MPADVRTDGSQPRFPWRILGWGTAGALLLLPWIANAPWTPFDYIVAAAAFAAFGLAFELAVRSTPDRSYRAGAAVALVTAFLLLWINGAAGIIGSENNPANLMFVAVIALALAGAVVARFRAAGMARAMAAAAAAQAVVAVIIFDLDLGASEPPGPGRVVALIMAFAAAWLLSAWLFSMSARKQAA